MTPGVLWPGIGTHQIYNQVDIHLTSGPSSALASRKPAFGRMVNLLVKPGTNYALLFVLFSICVFACLSQAKYQAWIVKWACVVFEQNNFYHLTAGSFFKKIWDSSRKKHNQVIAAVPRITSIFATSTSTLCCSFFLGFCSHWIYGFKNNSYSSNLWLWFALNLSFLAFIFWLVCKDIFEQYFYPGWNLEKNRNPYNYTAGLKFLLQTLSFLAFKMKFITAFLCSHLSNVL